MKKIIIIATCALFAGLLTLLVFQHFKLKKATNNLQLARLEIAAQNDSITVIKMKSGKLAFQLQTVQIDRDNLKEALEELNISTFDLKQQNLKWRNITLALQAQLAVQGNATTVVVSQPATKDSTAIEKFNWTNKYLFVSGELAKKKTGKTLSFNYIYKTEIQVLQANNSKGTVISLTLTDPNASITRGASFTVNHKKNWWEKWYFTIPLAGLTGYTIAKIN
jgi:hypothetical protein